MRHRTVPDAKIEPSAPAASSAANEALAPLSYGTPDPKRRMRNDPVQILLIILLICIGAFFVGDFILEWPSHGPSAGVVSAVTQSDFSSLQEALSAFNADTGRFPSTSGGFQALLTAPPGIANWHGPYILHSPKDPWGNAYAYHFSVQTGIEIRCAGRDGKIGTSDDIVNAFNPPKSP
jgi:general secretion pathway protein G